MGRKRSRSLARFLALSLELNDSRRYLQPRSCHCLASSYLDSSFAECQSQSRYQTGSRHRKLISVPWRLYSGYSGLAKDVYPLRPSISFRLGRSRTTASVCMNPQSHLQSGEATRYCCPQLTRDLLSLCRTRAPRRGPDQENSFRDDRRKRSPLQASQVAQLGELWW